MPTPVTKRLSTRLRASTSIIFDCLRLERLGRSGLSHMDKLCHGLRSTSPCKGEVDRLSVAMAVGWGSIETRDIDPHPARFARRPPPWRGRYTASASHS